MSTSFSDHFSGVAGPYAAYRPGYPPELFRYLASLCRHRDLAWDCATGSGQAAVPLARHFRRVVATDASAAQLRHAAAHPRVQYRVAAAEHSGISGGSADLVTVAQALHWFDRPAFFREARRVLRAGGVIAVWSYARLELDDARIQALIDEFYHDVVGPFWLPERTLVEEGYRSVEFPFQEIEPPLLEMSRELTADALAGYLGTWSATQRFREARGSDPVPPLMGRLAPLWGEPATARLVRWPLALRVGYSSG